MCFSWLQAKNPKRESRQNRTRSDSESLDEFGRSKVRRTEDCRRERRHKSRSRSGSSVERRRRVRHKYRSSSNSDSDRHRSRQKTRSKRSPRRRTSKHKKSPEKRRRKRSRSPSSVEEGELSAGTTSHDSCDERKKVTAQDGETVVEFKHPRKGEFG